MTLFIQHHFSGRGRAGTHNGYNMTLEREGVGIQQTHVRAQADPEGTLGGRSTTLLALGLC